MSRSLTYPYANGRRSRQGECPLWSYVRGSVNDRDERKAERRLPAKPEVSHDRRRLALPKYVVAFAPSWRHNRPTNEIRKLTFRPDQAPLDPRMAYRHTSKLVSFLVGLTTYKYSAQPVGNYA